MPATSRSIRRALLGAVFFAAACSGGGGGGDSGSGGGVSPPPPPPPPPPPAGTSDATFETPQSTARFLTQATFGPEPDRVTALTGTSASDWFLAELAKPPSLNLPYVLDILSDPDSADDDGTLFTFEANQSPTWSFWRNAIDGDDQLRQRMAFALSQILVVSGPEGTTLFALPMTMAHYQDILVQGAFGNYRDLLEAVTYSPAMGEYLTYLQNQKGDPDTGRMPDENYAREIMQLFTIGLVELEPNGEARTDGSGQTIETYTNEDVTGLAKVFTGLSLDVGRFDYRQSDLTLQAFYSDLAAFPEFHSDLEKSFLDTTIPPGVGPEASIDAALDALVAHPNVGPFLGRQLIQRFVTSDPDPAYVARVAAAFDAGTYTLPDGQTVGDGRRGDLAATLAAVLMDEEAREADARADDGFGKLREPVLRFTQWARAFDADPVDPENMPLVWNTSGSDALAQAPYKAPSVFNFYRPGYVAPGTLTGDAGLTVPELQIVNASSLAGYANFLTYFALELQAGAENPDIAGAFRPDYSDEEALASDPAALVAHLNQTLAFGSLSPESAASIEAAVAGVPLSAPGDPNYDGPRFRTQLAIIMLMNSPDYIVQR